MQTLCAGLSQEEDVAVGATCAVIFLRADSGTVSLSSASLSDHI